MRPGEAAQGGAAQPRPARAADATRPTTVRYGSADTGRVVPAHAMEGASMSDAMDDRVPVERALLRVAATAAWGRSTCASSASSAKGRSSSSSAPASASGSAPRYEAPPVALHKSAMPGRSPKARHKRSGSGATSSTRANTRAV